MSVRRKKDGGTFYYSFMYNGRRYNGVCEGCTTKREAEAYERRKRSFTIDIAETKSVSRLIDRRRQEITGGVVIPLSEAFEKSLCVYRGNRTTSALVIARKREMFADFVAYMEATHPQTKDVASVTPEHAERYAAILKSSGRFRKEVVYFRNGKQITRPTNTAPSNRTINMYTAVCSEVFRLLAREAGLPSDPFNLPKLKKNEETREAFSEDELRLIFSNLDDFSRPLFTVAVATALREGDICTLKWSEVNFSGGVIQRVMNKTARLVEIPMTAELQGYLWSQKEVSGESEYVFPNHAKMYLENQTGVSYRIKQFLERLGIETTRRPKGRKYAVSVKDLHSCRHTFCYYAGLRGIPLVVVQSIVGHLTPAMTQHYMAHANRKDKEKAIRSMPSFMQLAATTEESEKAEILQEFSKLPLDTLKKLKKALENI